MTETDLTPWIGKSETASDIIDPRAPRLMQSVYDDFEWQPNDNLPPLWHWLYFPNATPLADTARDGHPKLGEFLPPTGLPRRMWAGGRFRFFAPLKIGDKVKKNSTIKSISRKSGRSGELCFVTVAHEFYVENNLCLSEEHDIVYRENTKPGAAVSSNPHNRSGDWNTQITPGPVTLFRYSALTFNPHRIHYDRDYCKRVEGYEGLIFHGPLTATLLVNLALRNNKNKTISSFAFKAHQPLFDTEPFEIDGLNTSDGSEMWASTPEGDLAMEAKAVFD